MGLELKLLIITISALLIGSVITESFAQSSVTIQSLAQEIEKSKTSNDNKIILLVYTDLKWVGEIQDGNYVSHQISGDGNKKFSISCGETNVASVLINPSSKQGTMDVYLIKEGKILKNQSISTPGETFESSINCSAPGQFQMQDAESAEEFDYFLAGSSIVAIIVTIMIIKNRFWVKQKNTSSSNYR